MPDMVFSNAIFGSKVLKEGDQTEYSRLKAHIERGLFDIPVDELLWSLRERRTSTVICRLGTRCSWSTATI